MLLFFGERRNAVIDHCFLSDPKMQFKNTGETNHIEGGLFSEFGTMAN
jgi:hypothetical protein